MRISDVSISNFKGLAKAEISAIGTESVVMISGRNGTGKSLLLNAIAAVWNGHLNPDWQIGPYGDECFISISIQLTEGELAAVNSWSQKTHGTTHEGHQAYTISYVLDRLRNSVRWADPQHPVLEILRNPSFQREYPFARLDYLPASRQLTGSSSPTVNLSMFSPENMQQQRNQLANQSLGQEIKTVSLPDISSYLATLDYQGFLAQRQGLDATTEYELITSAFAEATGKRILQPTVDVTTGESGIYVEVAGGLTHSINALSSGEQGLLGLMYFVRRLSASGGVLLLDEPEQHLHPTLQAALFEALKGLADRAQVLVVSHSASLISTAPLSGLLQVGPANGDSVNQVEKLNDHPERASLLATLGVTPAQVLQSDALLVVEGDTDKKWLNTLFPVEMGRLHVLVAGDCSQVLSAHKTLSEFPLGIPWLCLRDRDLISDAERAALMEKNGNLHVWDRRAVENYLLDASLITSLMTSIGRLTSEGKVEEALQRAVKPLQEEVLGELVEKEVARRFPPPGASPEGNRFQKIKWQYAQYAEINQKRADAVFEVEEVQRSALNVTWSSKWPELVNPKSALARLNSDLSLFRTPDDLKMALFAKARDEPSLRPAGLEEFRARLAALLA